MQYNEKQVIEMDRRISVRGGAHAVLAVRRA